MNKNFGPESTAEEVLFGHNLKGKRVLITGASAGLGIETSRSLATQGAEIVGAVRDISKGENATMAVSKIAAENGGSFSLIRLDLASQANVRETTDALLVDGRPFDIIIANAGIMATPFTLNSDGIESQFGTNFIGHFLLINRLFPLLRRGGRIIILASGAHQISDVDISDINFDRDNYDPWVAYGRSKTACVLFAVELDKRSRAHGIRAAAVHPGSIKTELQRHYSTEEEEAKIALINENNRKAGRPDFKYKSVEQGAATTVWAAVAAPADVIGGRYCEDCHVADVENENGIRYGVRSYAIDPIKARELWITAETLTGEYISQFEEY